MFTNIQQFHQLLGDAKQIALVLTPEKNEDAIAAALAWKLFLEKQGKQAEVCAEGFAAPKSLKFLPGIDQIKPTLSSAQKFIIKVDVSKTKIESLSYDIKDDYLSIYLTPKQGALTKNDLRAGQSALKHDLIFSLGAADLNALGKIFLDNAELFYHAPIANFDFRADNEHFGQLNFVDLTATSVSEISYKIMERLGETYLDQEIATCLLTGMISETRSFKTANVSPHTLHLASKLINLGADREKIVQNLYRTKSIATLKLWGKALSNLQTDKEIGLVWTTITRDDFIRSGANHDDLKDIISELISNSPEAQLVLLLHESAEPGQINLIKALLTSEKQHDALALLAAFQPEGNKHRAGAVLENKNLGEAQEEIIKTIRENLKMKN